MTHTKKLAPTEIKKLRKQTEKVVRSQCSQRIGKLLYWSTMPYTELVDLEIRLQKMYPEIQRLPIIQIKKLK